MVDKTWWKNIYFGHTKVIVDVLVLRVCGDDWMFHGVLWDLVHPGVEGCDIDVFDFFFLTFMYFVMEAYCVHSSTNDFFKLFY